MKKVFTILLALAMGFSLMACQSGDSSKTPDDPGKETTQKADDKTTKADEPTTPAETDAPLP